MFLVFGKWDECKDNIGVVIFGVWCWGWKVLIILYFDKSVCLK